ncbi:butyrophilin-like protein 2 [Parambassis ranga]|uniref:Butyrophilin-like protein 2 n=1 Tax=Parambassis ranga TaxID=210632 RepID=A0A6P7I3J0_9TELE|nr:butyrophilin-like protein 2 [Parambassis ranga]
MKMEIFMMFVILVHVFQHTSAVELYEGGTFVLPCEFHTFDLDDPTAVWKRYDLSPSTVHQRQLDSDELRDQNQRFKGRTSMKADALETGDLSLSLTNLQPHDSGTYTCTVRAMGGEWRLRDVDVQVKERFPFWAKALLIALVFTGTVVCCILIYFRSYIMSGYQVVVDSGAWSVELPCRTTVRLPKDVKVEWTRNDFKISKVHVYPDYSLLRDEQHLFYRKRTSMNSELRERDLSLTLFYPTDIDRDIYTCTAYKGEKILLKKHVRIHIRDCEVEVKAGVHSVLLPFRTVGDLPADAEVEWWRFEPEPWMTLHKYQNGSDQLEEQFSLYRGRTKMNADLLETGDLSLTLLNPTEKDAGIYICRVDSGSILRGTTVVLKVMDPNSSIHPFII